MKKILLFIPIIAFSLMFLSTLQTSGYVIVTGHEKGYFPDCNFPFNGQYPATTRQYGNGSDGIVDSPPAYEAVMGEWGNSNGIGDFPWTSANQSVDRPTAIGFNDETSNTSGFQTNGLISKYDNIMYRTHDTNPHWVYTSTFDNKQYHPTFWGIANPECSFPNTQDDVLYKIYLKLDIAWYRPAGTLSLWVYNESIAPYFFWYNFPITSTYGVNASYTIDVTNVLSWNIPKVVGYSAQGGSGSDTWAYRVYFNYTGNGDYVWIDYLGISYEYINGDYFTNSLSHLGVLSLASKRYESESSPFWRSQWSSTIGGAGTLYIANKDFNANFFPSKWWPKIVYPNSSCILTDIKIILVAEGDIPPCWLSFSMANSSAWNYAHPWISDLQNGTTWINSSVFPAHSSEIYHWDGSLPVLFSKYPDRPSDVERWLEQSAEFGYTGNMLDGITTDGAHIPEMYVWDITGLRSWNISDVIYSSVYNSTPLTVMATFNNTAHNSFGIEYLGIFYGFTYAGSGYFPKIIIPENNIGNSLIAMTYLLLVFLPGILIAEVVPKFGFVIGVIFSVTILGIAVGNGIFLGFMMFTYLSVGIMMYRGGMN